MNVDFDRLSEELVVEQLKFLSLEELKQVCLSNKRVANICKKPENEKEIYANLIRRDFGSWTEDPKLLYYAMRSPDILDPTHHSRLLKRLIDRGDFRSLRSLIKNYNLDVNFQLRMFTGQNDPTLLEYAMTNVNLDVIDTLLELGADVNAHFFRTESPIFYALRDTTGAFPQKTLIKMLRKGADFNVRLPISLETLFHVGMNNPTLPSAVLRMLLEKVPDINLVDQYGRSILHNLLTRNMHRVDSTVRRLILGKYIDFNLQEFWFQTTPLISALSLYDCNSHETVNGNIRLLVSGFLDKMNEHNTGVEPNAPGLFDIDAQDNQLFTALMHALFFKVPASLVIKLLEATPPPNVNLLDRNDDSAFIHLLRTMGNSHLFMESYRPVLEIMLTRFEPDLNTGYLWSETPLMKVLRYKFPDDIIFTILEGTQPYFITEHRCDNTDFERNTLMYALKYEASDRIVNVIKAYYTPEQLGHTDTEGNNALMHALRFHQSISNDTIFSFMSTSNVNLKNRNRRSPLFCALHYINNPRVNPIVRALLNFGAVVTDSLGEYAAYNEYFDMSILDEGQQGLSSSGSELGNLEESPPENMHSETTSDSF